MARERKEDRDNEINNTFYIPNNYTDSGRVFQGMFEVRNVVEAIAACVILGYLLWSFLTFEIKMKIVVMAAVLIPIGILALIGFQGDCLTKFFKTIFMFLRNKRKLRYRRIKKNVEKTSSRGKQKATNKKAKSKTKTKTARTS